MLICIYLSVYFLIYLNVKQRIFSSLVRWSKLLYICFIPQYVNDYDNVPKSVGYHWQSPEPLRAKLGLGTKIKSGPPQSDKKMVRQNDEDNLPEEALCCIEIINNRLMANKILDLGVLRLLFSHPS